MKRKVIHIGNAAGVTLPSALLAQYGLKVGDEVDVTPTATHIELSPRRTISDLLDQWAPVADGVQSADIVQALHDERVQR